jgi:capsular polysaccharide transport system ATP-binding protein
MIVLSDLTKSYPLGHVRRVLFEALDLTLPAGARIALMGPNGAGKSTLMGLIAGTVRPDRGQVLRGGSVSWPIGFAGSFAPDLTGVQNARFVARIYGADTDRLVDFVAAFSELGASMRMPVRTYSAGMRARLAFGLSMGLRFDWYLVDEVAAVGDARFRERALAMFRERLGHAGLVMVSHSMPMLRDYCRAGIVIAQGRALWFDDLEAAIACHEAAMAGGTLAA